jgi:hypothetical protein
MGLNDNSKNVVISTVRRNLLRAQTKRRRLQKISPRSSSKSQKFYAGI